MQAPIVLFVYNRIEHTKQVLQALDKNIDADKSELYIFSDAPADETEKENVAKVREYIDAYSRISTFKHVEICYAHQNKGLSASLIDGITRVINQYGRIIVLEDDHVTSPDFIIFMNRALDYYEFDSKIWSISGFVPNLKILHRFKDDVFCGCRGYCWGWATWKNRFDKVDWEVKDYDTFIGDKNAQRKFNQGGKDMTPLLRLQHEGKVNSWAIRWCYQQYKENMLTIFPKHSKVKNIGMDGSGTNSGSENVYRTELIQDEDWDFRYNENDTRISKKMSDYQSMLYFRQVVGKYWYRLTEYEHCVAYHMGETDNKYHVLKPDFRRGYGDPIPFCYRGKYYVFMKIFDKVKKKGYIGLSDFDSEGRLKKPIKIIEEPFHMSFPNVFEYKGAIYMIPACETLKEIRIYKMKNDDVYKWFLYHTFIVQTDYTDIAVHVEDDSSLFFLASEVNAKNYNQSRLVLLGIENLENIDNAHIQLLWAQEEYTYSARNGGNFIQRDKLFRVARHSSKEICGKFITLNKVSKLNDTGVQEEITEKISLMDIPTLLPAFIYRVLELHTFGQVDSLKTAGLFVQRFSLWGIFEKIRRLLKGEVPVITER